MKSFSVGLTMHIPTRSIKRHAYQSHFSDLCGFKGQVSINEYVCPLGYYHYSSKL